MRIWGGYDGMKVKQHVINACNVNYTSSESLERSLLPVVDVPNYKLISNNNLNEDEHEEIEVIIEHPTRKSKKRKLITDFFKKSFVLLC